VQTFRSLLRSKQFTVLAVATFAAGIGGNLAIFGALDSVFFRPLPFEDVDHLVWIHDINATPDGQSVRTNVLDTHLLELVSRAHQFVGLGAADDQSMTLSRSGSLLRVNVLSVTAHTFTVLGIHPLQGRLFTADEERQGASAGVALLSHRIWLSDFAGRLETIGQSIRLDDRSFQIVGILPVGFRFPWEADVWIPEIARPTGRRDYAVFGRIPPHVTLSDVSANLNRVASEIRYAHPETLPGYGLEARPFRESLMQGHQRASLALFLLAAIFLLMACANVTNLQLARLTTRQRDLAVRAALGASLRKRLSAVLGESAYLAVAGTFAGLLLALWLSSSFAVLIPTNLTRELGVANHGVDSRLIVFALAICSLCAICSGFIPSVAASRITASTLRQTGRGLSPTTRRALTGFVVAQVVLVIMLLASASVVLQEFVRMSTQPAGVDVDHVTSVTVALPKATYGTPTAKILVARRILDAVLRIPGVDSAAISTINPFSGPRWVGLLEPEGRTAAINASSAVNQRLVTADFIRTWRLPLLSGRPFSSRDSSDSQPVALLSAKLAAHLWPNQDPIGRRLRSLRAGEPWREVVGVVADVPDQGDVQETWYIPYDQGAAGPFVEAFSVMAHTQAEPKSISMALFIQSVDPALPVYDSSVLADRLHDQMLPSRLSAIVVGVLSGFGLVLALIGTYSVTSYISRSHRRDNALRIVLGASIREITLQEFRYGLKAAIAGIVIGVAGAKLSAETVRQVLGVNDAVPATVLVGLGALVLVVTSVAGLVPAMRSGRMIPIDSMRQE